MGSAPSRTGVEARRNVRRSPDHSGFIAGQLQRVLSELRILRDDVDVVAATTRRLDNSYDRLVSEMREIREELRAMHAQHQRTAARVRAIEER
jgi:hypothetical protein